ncbi:MAG: hypothetical protein ACOH2L_02715 [Devosia sp.]
MKKIILSTLVVLGMSGAAFAQTATDFVTVDTDASGSVSFEEAQVAWPDLTTESFATADTDANGELSAEEYALILSTAPAAVPATN